MPGARLTVEQRRTMERGYRIGLSQGQVASIIRKSPSTVSRELARPKGADLRNLTQTDCDDVALRLDTRPRQALNWQIPGQALNDGLVATAV